MKLELQTKEVEAILLKWAEEKWPGAFNTVDLSDRYSENRAIFTHAEPDSEKE